jgi:hypothetical protein
MIYNYNLELKQEKLVDYLEINKYKNKMILLLKELSRY